MSYLSPEVIKSEYYKLEPDIWSLGCILYEIITLHKAFIGSNDFEVQEKIVNGNYDKNLLTAVSNCPKKLAEFVTTILNVNHKERPDIVTLNSKYIYFI